METIVLACGDSKRFTGYSDVPKQFIDFRVTPDAPPAQMWENTLYGMYTRSEVIAAFRIDHHQHVLPPVRVKANAVWLEPTRGQADTLLKALNVTNVFNQEVLVVNCDQGFEPGVLDRLVQHGRKNFRTAALTFTAPASEANRWSYVDSHPWFSDAAEKQAIGTHALAGAYYFPDRTMLVRYLTKLLTWNVTNEPYISQVFSMMPGYKLSVEIKREQWYDWGTPDALENFLQKETQ